MFKKKYIPAHNCIFHVAKGKLTILPTIDFTPGDLLKTFDMSELHAKIKKIKLPDKINDISKTSVITIPTLAA